MFNNKWIRAAVPALLIHCSIGTVYCWSTFKEAIAQQIGMDTFSVGWAFSLAIFFLGMSAAFAGKLVEKNVKRSSLIARYLFHIRNDRYWVMYTVFIRNSRINRYIFMLWLHHGNRIRSRIYYPYKNINAMVQR